MTIMSAPPETKLKTNVSDKNQNTNAALRQKLSAQAGKIAQLEAKLQLQSESFSRTIAKITSYQKTKIRAAELDEQLIKQLVNEKIEAQNSLQNALSTHANNLAAVKVEAQKKLEQMNHHMASAKAQLEEEVRTLTRRLASIHKQTQQHSVRCEQTIAKVKAQNDQKLKAHQQHIAQLKAQIARLTEQVRTGAQAAARAEELNNRLRQQCTMAKAGADAEISRQSTAFRDQNAKIRTWAQQNVTKASANTERVEKQYSEALKKAAQRIRALEHQIAQIKPIAASHPFEHQPVV